MCVQQMDRIRFYHCRVSSGHVVWDEPKRQVNFSCKDRRHVVANMVKS
jgi:hypothetical protein